MDKEQQAKKDRTDIVALLAAHEEVISRLYKKFAQKFPTEEAFWLGLSIEEVEHSNWIKRLNERTDRDEAEFQTHIFKAPAIESSINFIEDLIKNDDKIINEIAALSMAVNLEKSLLENRYFQVFKSDSLDTVETLGALEKSTREHLHRVTEMLHEMQQN